MTARRRGGYREAATSSGGSPTKKRVIATLPEPPVEEDEIAAKRTEARELAEKLAEEGKLQRETVRAGSVAGFVVKLVQALLGLR